MYNSTEKPPKTVTETKGKTYHIPMYKVLFHNDKITSMEFVTFVLKQVFTKSQQDAEQVTQEVHKTGVGIAGVYPMEHAEMRRDITLKMAQKDGFPLKVTIEADK